MKDHGTYPRYYEDNLEKKQDFALEACAGIAGVAQKRKCYRDITSNTSAGTAISTQSEPSKYDRVQQRRKARFNKGDKLSTRPTNAALKRDLNTRRTSKQNQEG